MSRNKYLKDPLPVRIRSWFDKQYEKWWTLKFGIWASQYLSACVWIWQHLIYPIVKKMVNLYKWFSALYIGVWNKVTYKNGKFSRMRGAMTIFATLVFFVFMSIFTVLVAQTALYLATNKSEVIFLSNSQEIGEDIHAIKGCTKFPCDENDSVYFRVRSTPFNQVWSLFDSGHLYYPDYVASVVAPGYNICETKSYGVRIKMFMRRQNDNWYPDLLYASCSPYKQ